MEQEIPVPACYFPPRLFWWCYSLPMPPLPTTIFVLLYRLMGIALLAFLLLSSSSQNKNKYVIKLDETSRSLYRFSPIFLHILLISVFYRTKV